MPPITVLKFGSSVLHAERDLPIAVQEIYRHVRRGRRVVAVVSALGRTTDRLIAQARALTDRPESSALAALLATGESTTVALLALALERSGIPTTVFDAARAGIRTEGDQLDAEPVGLDVPAIREALSRRPVAIVPGFLGRHADGSTSLLGRGGSDLTALFLASRLGADECRLLKDVDGVYDGDPNAPAVVAHRFAELDWDRAAQIGGRIVQPKSLRFARDNRLCFEVTAAAAAHGTVIGPGPTRTAQPAPASGPLRVGLLGLGTVGLGVYQRLAAQPDQFKVTRIAVRDIRKHANDGVPPDLFTNDPWEVLQSPCDVLVEVIGGRRPATALIAAALRRGISVVTANKEVIAVHGRRLEAIARAHGARLLYSAAVGGGVPVLEAVRFARETSEIAAISGVLNGTTNFVIDGVAEGLTYAEAVREAQRHGFAEADPTTDLDGTDAAHKLVLVAREAFGDWISPGAVERQGIQSIDPALLRDARARGQSIRLVASCRKAGGRIDARVQLVHLPRGHALAGVRREENCILIETADGSSAVVAGKGAGRWPTTEAIVADLFDVRQYTRPAARTAELAAG